jgi:hypothetical protein
MGPVGVEFASCWPFDQRATRHSRGWGNRIHHRIDGALKVVVHPKNMPELMVGYVHRVLSIKCVAMEHPEVEKRPSILVITNKDGRHDTTDRWTAALVIDVLLRSYKGLGLDGIWISRRCNLVGAARHRRRIPADVLVKGSPVIPICCSLRYY